MSDHLTSLSRDRYLQYSNPRAAILTRELAVLVRRSNQLSYEARGGRNWSFVGSNVPIMNESTTEIIYMKRV